MKVDLGGGRGLWLEEAPAKSLARAQRDLGRQWQITEAGRYRQQQQEHWDRYVAYLNGGPWAPIAAKPGSSVHEYGAAIDTNDRFVWLLNDHGWYQTVYRNGALVEPWHFEYFPARDNHRHEVVTLVNIGGTWMIPGPNAAPASTAVTPFIPPQEDDMAYRIIPLADKTIRAQSLVTGEYVHIQTPYHVQLLNRVLKNDNNDTMLEAELQVTRGYIRAMNPPAGAVVDVPSLVAQMQKLWPEAGSLHGVSEDEVRKAVNEALIANTTSIAKATADTFQKRLLE